VIVRRDLEPSQQAVQGGHAVAEYLLSYPNTEWRNGTLVYLGVSDKEDIDKWQFRLDLEDVPYSIFREPDMNNEITAISSVYDESFFKKLQLL